jgi:putative transposase
MIQREHPTMSIQRQCTLLQLSRSAYYYHPVEESEENLRLMRLLDEQYLKTPFYGSRRMTEWFQVQGYLINRKRVQRLMRQMGLEGIAPGPHTSNTHPGHRRYPYLLRDTIVVRPNQAWCVDITYVPMALGFMYLVAIMDWFSRYVIAWAVSNTLDMGFCLDALEHALSKQTPEIFNSDQGVQFTSQAWIERVEAAGSAVSMDGRGRVFDNIFIERLWRSVKYEDIYLKDYATGPELIQGLRAYFEFYNYERPHQAHDYQTPYAMYAR